MDCGPAVLSAVLNAYNVPAGYDRLREACQTDLDGTSIDVLEETLQAFNLDADQRMVPADHLFRDSQPTLPAIFVVNRPNGLTHFVVAWRKIGRQFLEVMDPSVGRHTVSIESFIDSLYHHHLTVPADAWREYAGTEEFLGPLKERLQQLGIRRTPSHLLLQRAAQDPSWQSLATLDAAVRFAQALRSSGRGQTVDPVLLDKLIDRSRPRAVNDPLVPWGYWSIEPAPTDEDGDAQVLLKGAVLITLPEEPPSAVQKTPAALKNVLAPPPPRPEQLLWRLFKEDGLLNPLLLLTLLFIAAATTLIEALFWRGTLEFADWGLTGEQQTVVFGGFLGLMLLNLWLKKEKNGVALYFARHIELRLRLAILQRLPRVQSRYFGTRPVADMAERNHSLFRLREIPLRGSRLIELLFLIVLSNAALVMMTPSLGWLAIINSAIAITVPLLTQSALQEKDLQVRTHVGALTQFYLDALRGIVPVRAHGAEQSILREQEHLLVSWANARWQLVQRTISYEAVQQTLGTMMVVAYIGLHVWQGLPLSRLLLAAYWLLNTIDYGQELALIARLYPTLRNHLLRGSELVSQDDLTPASAAVPVPRNRRPSAGGVQLCARAMSVRIGGQIALSDIDVDIPAGEHVAIVGPSGAGKSTFVGTLLGWHLPFSGCIEIDGRPLTEHNIDRLREETIWIDPAVQLWNQPLWDNVTYGVSPGDSIQPADIISQAELIDFLEQLPDGWRTYLGEDGRLISGGEGQRVRFGRGLNRARGRLVLFDEPFRGLDRSQRSRLLASARRTWSDATLLCVTHDLAEAKTFDRVLFFYGGRLIQQGRPETLKAQADGPFAHYLHQHERLAKEVWHPTKWRRWRLEEGKIKEGQGDE